MLDEYTKKKEKEKPDLTFISLMILIQKLCLLSKWWNVSFIYHSVGFSLSKIYKVKSNASDQIEWMSVQWINRNEKYPNHIKRHST